MSHFLVNDHINTHWKELLLQDGVITSSELSPFWPTFCDSQFFTIILPSMKCKRRCTILKLIEECGCASCKCLFESLSNMFYMMSDSWSTTKADPYTKMASMETFRELEKFPPDQQQQLITQVLKEALPAAKDDLFIDEIRPLLYQNGVITSEEATELLGIFTGEEKVTRLYTKMLPSKGVKGLKKFMKILHDTGWKTPSHMLHHSVLSKILAEKLLQIKSNEAVLHQYENRRAAREAIVPTVYSESLPDAVVNLSKGVNKLLLLMVKKHIVSVTDYCWLRGAFYRGRKLEYLYNEVLPQKGVKGFKAFMEVLQDVGRKIPTYQNHRDQLKSSLQAHLLKL